MSQFARRPSSAPPRSSSGVRAATGHGQTAASCAELMMKHVFCVAPNTTLAHVAGLMRDEGIGFVVVVEANGALAGVVTDRDIVVRGCAEHLDPERARVSAIMSSDVLSCSSSDPLEVAISLMQRHQKERIVVRDENGGLAGVITFSDVTQAADPIRVARLARRLSARDYRVRGTRF